MSTLATPIVPWFGRGIERGKEDIQFVLAVVLRSQHCKWSVVVWFCGKGVQDVIVVSL